MTESESLPQRATTYQFKVSEGGNGKKQILGATMHDLRSGQDAPYVGVCNVASLGQLPSISGVSREPSLSSLPDLGLELPPTSTGGLGFGRQFSPLEEDEEHISRGLRPNPDLFSSVKSADFDKSLELEPDPGESTKDSGN
eukprot:TRINITY_DN6635_c0_g1_i1.p1 TRINITY_DN6635_c0_g1~~TRINITY_DN6635_c0_g1_i1.p1  ORF type:complete len:141 (-),score=17.33 TRINITY_DN6635_c0_g1_i1:219-641(-)